MPLFDTWPEHYAAWFATPIGRLVYRVELELVLDLLQPRAARRAGRSSRGAWHKP